MAVASPENDGSFCLDMNATPKSIPLTSLFDTFVQEGQPTGAVADIDNSLIENTLHDPLFGLYDDSYLPESFGWS